MAENYIRSQNAWELSYDTPAKNEADPLALAELRRDVSKAAGFSVVLRSQRDTKAMSFCNRSDVAKIAQQGPATPDHVIRTKRLPQVGRDVTAYVEAYKNYFNQHAPDAREPKTMLDPAPRVILHKELGMISVGKSVEEAQIVTDIYDHTIEINEVNIHVRG